VNLIEKFSEALRRFSQVVGDEIDFHGGDAHARIVGVKSRKHKMEELIGVLQVAAPGIQILVDQAERLIGTVDGKFEKALGLLLGRQVADYFRISVISARIGGWHQSGPLNKRGRQWRGSVKPSQPSDFKAGDAITGEGGNSGEQNQKGDVTRQTIRSIRFAMSGPLQVWSGPRGPGDVF